MSDKYPKYDNSGPTDDNTWKHQHGGDRSELNPLPGYLPESLAREFHETYERLAPEHGYKTREESAVAWEDVPAANKNLMIAVCDHLLSR
jgi:hypothetical protein